MVSGVWSSRSRYNSVFVGGVGGRVGGCMDEV